MPKITIEIMKGLAIEQKRDIAEAMCAEATRFFKVSPENILMRIEEIDPDDFFINGNACDALQAGVFITLFYIEGRSVEVLRRFAKEMTEKLSAILGIAGCGIFIHFISMKKDELSRRGLLICDM